MIKTYKKLPIPVQAAQWNGTDESLGYIMTLAEGKYEVKVMDDSPRSLMIETLEGWHKTKLGDYVLKGIEGEIYACDLGIFEKTYIES